MAVRSYSRRVSLTIVEAAEFREAFLALSAKPGQLELNLANIERVDSSSVQLVVAACEEMALPIADVSPGHLYKPGILVRARKPRAENRSVWANT